jgi:DNA-binding HxlR family transcriptional regulator
MLGKTYDGQVCSAARALEAVGERWSLLIVRTALYGGVTRFNDFRKSLGIATNILSTRLDGLVESGIMRRHRYSEVPECYEYLLTDKGRDLGPVLIALSAWGDRWAAPDGPPIRYIHEACGREISQSVLCAGCGPVPDPGEVRAQPGPGMPEQLLARFAACTADSGSQEAE